jgi:polyhydroxyalkanoate synthesis regulator phasin
MVLDGLRGYIQLANGLTDVTRERARLAAKTLVAQGEASVGAVLPDSLKAQVGSLTEDLIATSKVNRALLVNLVAAEVERATSRLGLTLASELEAAEARSKRLEQKVAELERELHDAQAASAAPKPAPKTAAPKTAAARKTTAKKTSPKRTTGKKASTKKESATKASATKAAAPGATAEQAT